MIAQYQGLNVNELDALRKELRDKGILFKIKKQNYKNSFKRNPKKDLENILLDLHAAISLIQFLQLKF